MAMGISMSFRRFAVVLMAFVVPPIYDSYEGKGLAASAFTGLAICILSYLFSIFVFLMDKCDEKRVEIPEYWMSNAEKQKHAFRI
jgi:Na+/melibiose symporter-like transporter